MRKTIPVLLLLCLLLSGCGADPRETEAAAEPSPTVFTQPSLPETVSAAEEPVTFDEALTSFPLEISGCRDVRLMGDDLLLLSDTEQGTLLTLISGNDLRQKASLQLDFPLSDHDGSLQTGPEGVSFFHPETRETVLLEESLREVLRLPLPENMVGAPLLSPDRKLLYYSTGDSLWAMETETRICRVLRQEAGSSLIPEALHLEGTVLQCRVSGNASVTRFFSTENGQLLQEQRFSMELASREDRYIAAPEQEGVQSLLFGTAGEEPRMLQLSRPDNRWTLLPESFAVLRTAGADGEHLEYYDLTTGRLAASLTLNLQEGSVIRDSGKGILWLLTGDGQTLYRWDTNAAPVSDDTVYTGPYYTRSNPDLAGIAACQELAERIGDRHGVEVLIWEDVFPRQTWDYRMTEEYLVPVLTEQLNRLDAQLSHFPEGFLAQLSEHSSGLTICLVRSLRPTGSEAPEAVSGIQYWLEDRACIALSTLDAWEGSLYHELCHIFDTRVFAHSNAYDQWDKLNPSGFAYDYDYAANATRNAGEYLRDAERYFIDTYSMSYPKEDRARILEYAMTEGNEHFFQSKAMQAKLRQLCIGLREAFGLKKSPETFLWEQYLQESLAYTK